jgi:hydroxyacylglutathione hydrolase
MDFRYGSACGEGDVIRVGTLALEVRETPGHTPESISIVVRDRSVSERPYMVFTGDTLFAGETGRTDLVPGRRPEMSLSLHRSIHDTILPLGRGVIVFPAHGAGSVCGVEIVDHPVTSIGYEQETNPALGLAQEEFVRKKVGEHHYIPPYFHTMETYNRDGPPSLPHLPTLAPLNPEEFVQAQKDGMQIVDIRGPSAFAGAHIPGSLSIWEEGLSSFMGWFLDYDSPIGFVFDYEPDLAELMAVCVRLGYDRAAGYLAPGFSAWFKSGRTIETTNLWSVQDLFRAGEKDLFILDVRDINNRLSVGAIPGSHHIYIGHLPDRIAQVPDESHVVTYCDAGFKGGLAASILQRHGYPRVTNLLGGMTAWVHAGYPVEKITE